MIQELVHRVDSLLAGRTPRHNDALAALRDRWRILYEMTEVVPVYHFRLRITVMSARKRSTVKPIKDPTLFELHVEGFYGTEIFDVQTGNLHCDVLWSGSRSFRRSFFSFFLSCVSHSQITHGFQPSAINAAIFPTSR